MLPVLVLCVKAAAVAGLVILAWAAWRGNGEAQEGRRVPGLDATGRRVMRGFAAMLGVGMAAMAAIGVADAVGLV